MVWGSLSLSRTTAIMGMADLGWHLYATGKLLGRTHAMSKVLVKRLVSRHGTVTEFLLFLFFANAITILQLALMPAFKWIFSHTTLVNIAVHALPIGWSGGEVVYMFDYAAGPVGADGLGGGLAYFLAVQLTILIGQVLDFFAQRNVTFRSNTSIRIAAMWYSVAYVLVTVAAAALQVLYKAPVYSFMQHTFGELQGQGIADVVTMLINSTIAFWVFFWVFKTIFRRVPVEGKDGGTIQEKRKAHDLAQ